MPIASLAMYDWPELRAANDEIWKTIADGLRRRGIDAPEGLWRDGEESEPWTDPDLLLAQTCGYPYASKLRGQVRLVATPEYAAEGCDGPNYCSWLIVRRDSGLTTLSNLTTRRAAVNHDGSHSGWVALRAALPEFAGEVIWSGSHLQSLEAVKTGKAEFCSTDSVCWSLAQKHRPDLTADLQAVAATPSAPGLPLITAATRSDGEVEALRSAVREMLAAPDIADARARVLLTGASVLDDRDYDRNLELARQGGLVVGGGQ